MARWWAWLAVGVLWGGGACGDDGGAAAGPVRVTTSGAALESCNDRFAEFNATLMVRNAGEEAVTLKTLRLSTPAAPGVVVSERALEPVEIGPGGVRELVLFVEDCDLPDFSVTLPPSSVELTTLRVEVVYTGAAGDASAVGTASLPVMRSFDNCEQAYGPLGSGC